MNAFITHSLSALSYVHLHIYATYTYAHTYVRTGILWTEKLHSSPDSNEKH